MPYKFPIQHDYIVIIMLMININHYKPDFLNDSLVIQKYNIKNTLKSHKESYHILFNIYISLAIYICIYNLNEVTPLKLTMFIPSAIDYITKTPVTGHENPPFESLLVRGIQMAP